MPPEGFIVQSNKDNIYLLGKTSLGVRMAVISFLTEVGCRWFFPGDEWEIIPQNKTIEGVFSLKQQPVFHSARTMWYGFGAESKTLKDYEKWYYFNRLGGPVSMRAHHTDYNINIDSVIRFHPDWIAEVNGVRAPLKDTQLTKLCYSHPGVINAMRTYVLDEIEKGRTFVSMSPVDGADFCECARCAAVARGGKLEKRDYTIFATTPEGKLVNIVSENFFNAVNLVALTVRSKHPNVLLGTYAYSSFSHPPTFKIEPNVYIITSTHFRRTPLSLEEQVKQWGTRAEKLGIREYWSVYYWDYDKPEIGSFNPGIIKKDLKLFAQNSVTGVNIEAGNNWGPRGLSYYLGSKLLWDTSANINQLTQDFYGKAFGPAAKIMEDYYTKFYGPSVGGDQISDNVNPDDDMRTSIIKKENLKFGFAYLDKAINAVPHETDYAKRIDQLRMYFYFLLLRYKFQQAADAGEQQQFNNSLKEMLNFGMRLFETNMIHSLAMQQKRSIYWITKSYPKLMDNIPQHEELVKRGNPPSRLELDSLWLSGKNYLQL